MLHTFRISPRFYVTAPQPCPYLDGRMERKLFTFLGPRDGESVSDSLARHGFRRSQNVIYRPACPRCSACMSARIRCADFAPSRSQRRVLRRNAGLRRVLNSPWATQERYDLFQRYLLHRHPDGGMASMDEAEFAEMVEHSNVATALVDYVDPETDELVAVALTDILDDGLSMVYSFFDPGRDRSSLGTYMVLDHVSLALEKGLERLYLGYWVPGSEKMDYKAGFSALEILAGDAWRPIEGLDLDAARRESPRRSPIRDALPAIKGSRVIGFPVSGRVKASG